MLSLLTTVMCGCGITVQGNDEPTPTVLAFSPTPTPEASQPPAPLIDVEPTSLRFGQVTVGTSSTKTVGFYNNSTTVYHLTELILYSPIPYFAISELTSDVLEPGAAIQIDVTFRPAQTGSFQATLQLIAEEGDISAVPLSGTGIPAETTRVDRR